MVEIIAHGNVHSIIFLSIVFLQFFDPHLRSKCIATQKKKEISHLDKHFLHVHFQVHTIHFVKCSTLHHLKIESDLLTLQNLQPNVAFF